MTLVLKLFRIMFLPFGGGVDASSLHATLRKARLKLVTSRGSPVPLPLPPDPPVRLD